MIGSHNTFSYLPIKNKWLSFLKPWYKCQEYDIYTQIYKVVQFFDLRVRFNVNGCLQIVHNKIVFDMTEKQFWDTMTSAACFSEDKGNLLYFRVILDIRKKPKDELNQIYWFGQFLNKFKQYSKHIILVQAIVYWNWTVIDYNTLNLEVIEDHASVNAKWYEYMLGNKYYAAKVGVKYINEKSNDKVFLIDYV